MQRWRLLIGCLIFLATVALFNLTTFGRILDTKALDILPTQHTPHPDIALLVIDAKSLREIGGWPWSRNIHAQIIQKLKSGQPALIGYDITFPFTQDKNSDLALSDSLKAGDIPTVLAAQAVYVLGSNQPQDIIPPIFPQSDKIKIGHVHIPVSQDGVARQLPEDLSVQNQPFPAFDRVIASLLKVPLPQKSQRTALAGGAGTFKTYSASDVLNGTLKPDIFKDKIVLVGATASDLHDTVLVPRKNPVMSGVEWHANVVDNLLLKQSREILPAFLNILIGLAIGLLFLLSRQFLPPRRTFQILVLLAIILPISSLLAWSQGWALFYLNNLLLVAGLFTSHTVWQWYQAEAEKRQLRQRFQNYFSPAVLQAILADPKSLELGGQNKEISILFSDIRSFTTITESLPPEQLTSLLQEYFTEMSEEILATDGVIDKFIGDAIMAFWGAPINQPDHANRAVSAASGMIKRLERLQKKWLEAGYPLVDIGIGINTGIVTVGNMGSSKRFDYTIIGDDVNAASRLEGLNKEYKTHIIISEATKKQLTIPIKSQKIGDIKVKGKTKPTLIYQVFTT